MTVENTMRGAEAYNVFHRRGHPALQCAVRQDQPMPAFIQNEIWVFGSTLIAADAAPAGFLPAAAREATWLSGYYLFHALKA